MENVRQNNFGCQSKTNWMHEIGPIVFSYKSRGTPEDLDTLTSRLYDKLPNQAEFDNATHLSPRNAEVAEINKEFLLKIKTPNNNIYKCNGEDTYADGPKAGKLADKNDVYKKDEQCGGLSKEVEIAVGARVMLRKNLATKKGLVNGSMGTITRIQWAGLAKDQFKVGDVPEAVYVKFDDPTIACKFPESEKEGDSLRIELEKSTFEGKHDSYHTKATTANTQLGHQHT